MIIKYLDGGGIAARGKLCAVLGEVLLSASAARLPRRPAEFGLEAVTYHKEKQAMDTPEEKCEQKEEKQAEFLEGEITKGLLNGIGAKALLRFIEIVAVVTPVAGATNHLLGGTPGGSSGVCS
jgi:hypothetical protein